MPSTKLRYEPASGQILCPVQAEQTGRKGRTKQSFNTRITAQMVANGVNDRKHPVRPLQPYLCHYCGWWHNGRLPYGVLDRQLPFLVVGNNSSQVFYRFRGEPDTPIYASTLDLVMSGIDWKEATTNDAFEYSTLMQQLGYVQALRKGNTWAKLVQADPGLWAALWNLQRYNRQMVLRVKHLQPMVARRYNQLPPYNVLWAAESHT